MNNLFELTLNLLAFVLGGKSTFTIQNLSTGNRFTYKVIRADKGETFFVKVLTGSDNEICYTYMGAIFGGEKFTLTKASKIGAEALSYKAFNWLFSTLAAGKALPENVKFYHAGKCCKCGRKLTTPESIQAGIGPECAKKL
jgi:hypothetical protein